MSEPFEKKVRIHNSDIMQPVDLQGAKVGYDSDDDAFKFKPILPKYIKQTDLDETSPTNVDLDTHGLAKLGIYVKATTATNFYLYVSPDNSYWILWKTYSSVTEVKDTLDNPFRYVRITWDSAGTSGTDTVDIVLSAKQ